MTRIIVEIYVIAGQEVSLNSFKNRFIVLHNITVVDSFRREEEKPVRFYFLFFPKVTPVNL